MMQRSAKAAIALAFCAGCAQGEAAPDSRQEPHGAAPDAHAPVPDSAALARAAALALREPGALGMVAAAPVVGRTGPDGKPFEVALRTPETLTGHARWFGRRTLHIQLRLNQPDLTQYPCTSCHMGRGQVLKDERIADAHTSIRIVHPQETGATCATCHAADNVELLALRNGERASLDHVYRVCAQCHVAQADAWAAGAHGKRLDGWQGRRIVMGCADCHDPHAPALQPRMPFKPPRLHRPGSNVK